MKRVLIRFLAKPTPDVLRAELQQRIDGATQTSENRVKPRGSTTSSERKVPQFKAILLLGPGLTDHHFEFDCCPHR
jgi:hypothetical protein